MMSRSEKIPITPLPSTTGTAPIFFSASRVTTSLTRMSPVTLVTSLPFV